MIHGFEPNLTKKNAKIGYKATKKGLKPLFSWYQTYALNMVRTMRIELIWEAHTPLKRARLPIPPRPQRLSIITSLCL